MTAGKKRGGVRKVVVGGKSRRSKYKYPYLEPEACLKSRLEETIDVSSYKDQLNDEEKAWMNQFMKEYVNADTTNSEFHNTSEERKIVYDRNNARNRCWYTKEIMNNSLNLVGSDQELEALIYGKQEIGEEYEEVRDDSEVE